MDSIVLDGIATGRNVAIMGPPGTGKSTLVRLIKAQYSRVQLTASSGIAARQIGGMTVHRFCGLGDGRLSAQEYAANMRTSSDLAERIKSTDILVIDEISMLSAAVLEKVNTSLQSAMVIVVGDFLQLPPVPNAYSMDTGDWAFNSIVWRQAQFLVVKLTEVLRQESPTLVRCVQELAAGQLSEVSRELLERAAARAPDPKATHIFGTNYECDMHNARMLQTLPGPLHTYRSIDKGRRRELETISSVHELLCLRVGAPVIITSNIDDRVVNGTRAVVTGLHDNGVSVKLEDSAPHYQQLSLTISRTVFDRSRADGINQRKQFPLKLAWAITVHRCQGLTLEKLCLHPDTFFAHQHFCVAVSRVREEADFSIIGHSLQSLSQPDQDVVDFMQSGILKDLASSCLSTSDDSDVDDEVVEVRLAIPQGTPIPERDQPALSQLLAQVAEPDRHFVDWLWRAHCYLEGPEAKYRKSIRELTLTREYALKVAHLSGSSDEARWSSGYKIHSLVRCAFATVREAPAEETAAASQDQDLTDYQRGRLRYIAASYVQRIRKKRRTMNLRYSLKGIEHEEETKLKLLKNLTVSRQAIPLVTSDPAAQVETDRRQYDQTEQAAGGLIYITDELADWFYRLHIKVKGMAIHPERHLPLKMRSKLVSDDELLTEWKGLFPDESPVHLVDSLFEHFVRLRVTTQVYELCRSERGRLAKTVAHRLQINQLPALPRTQQEPASPQTPRPAEPISEEQAPEPELDLLPCLLCDSSDGDEDWIQCTECQRWLHISCTNESLSEHTEDLDRSWLCFMCQDWTDEE